MSKSIAEEEQRVSRQYAVATKESVTTGGSNIPSFPLVTREVNSLSALSVAGVMGWTNIGQQPKRGERGEAGGGLEQWEATEGGSMKLRPEASRSGSTMTISRRKD